MRYVDPSGHVFVGVLIGAIIVAGSLAMATYRAHETYKNGGSAEEIPKQARWISSKMPWNIAQADDILTDAGNAGVYKYTPVSDNEILVTGKNGSKSGDKSALSGQWKNANASMSDFSRKYQTQITRCKDKIWYQNGVKYDGMKNGILLDAKGKYAQFVDRNTGEFYSWFTGRDELIDEARRRINASEGARIQWYFAKKKINGCC